MPRKKKKKYYYIYKTICHANDTWYIGMRTCYCRPEEDTKYFGSGKRLRYCIRKYGEENHTKEILVLCKNQKELKIKEREIVNKKCVSDPKCMNLQLGGGGGFSSKEHALKCQQAGGRAVLKIMQKRHAEKIKSDPEYKAKWIQSIKDAGGGYHFKGKKHTKESKKKISDAAKKRKGKLNSQFGTFWITNEKESKKIKGGSSIPEGWRKGRKMKSKN